MNSRILQNVIDRTLADVAGLAEPTQDDLSKEGSAQELEGSVSDQISDEDVVDVEKTASVLEALAEAIMQNPSLAVATKIAAQAAFQGQGVQGPPGGPQPKVVKATGDKSTVQLGAAKTQCTESPLQAGVPGTSHVKTTEDEPQLGGGAPFGALAQKQAAAAQREELRRAVLNKMGMAAGPLTVWTGDQAAPNSPSLPMLQSNEAAIRCTKSDAKRRVVEQLKGILNEKAFSAAEDRVLGTAFDHTEGSKYANVREHLVGMVRRIQKEE